MSKWLSKWLSKWYDKVAMSKWLLKWGDKGVMSKWCVKVVSKYFIVLQMFLSDPGSFTPRPNPPGRIHGESM